MKEILAFLLLVLLHHFLLAPLIRKRLPLYIGLTLLLLGLFGVWCFSSNEHPQGPPPPPVHAEMAHHGPLRPETARLIIGILLVGVDLGAYFYVESRRKDVE